MLRDKQQHAPFRDVAFSSRFACSKRWRELSSEREQLTPSADPPRGRGRLTCRPKTDRPLSARRSAAAPPQGWRTFDLCSEETPCKPKKEQRKRRYDGNILSAIPVLTTYSQSSTSSASTKMISVLAPVPRSISAIADLLPPNPRYSRRAYKVVRQPLSIPYRCR